MRDINDRLYLTGIGIDRNDDELVFTFQIAEPVGASSAVDGNSVNYVNYVIYAQSMSEAFSSLERRLSASLDTEHLICVVFGDSVADSNILPLLEPLFGDSAVRRQCVVAYSSGSALAVMTGTSDAGSAVQVSRLLANVGGSGKTSTVVTLWDLYASRESGSGYYLYCVDPQYEAVSQSDLSVLAVTGAAIYNSSGKTVTLNSEQAALLRLLNGSRAIGVEYFSKNGTLCFKINESKRTISFIKDKNEYSLEYSVVCTNVGDANELSESELAQLAQNELYSLIDEMLSICKSSSGLVAFGLEKELRQRDYLWFNNANEQMRAERLSDADITLRLELEIERADGYL